MISVQLNYSCVPVCFPGITPDGIVGHSVGELGCAYADESFTAREVILAAYWRGMPVVC